MRKSIEMSFHVLTARLSCRSGYIEATAATSTTGGSPIVLTLSHNMRPIDP